jgi:hypothetical protein
MSGPRVRNWIHGRVIRPHFALALAASFVACGPLRGADVAKKPAGFKPVPVMVPMTAAGMAGPVKSARLQKLQNLVGTRDWLKDPFRHLQSDMVYVVDDLADGETRVPAEISEPKILSRLDTLIEMLEKQCKKGGGAGGSPLRRSILAGGPGGQGDLNAPRNNRRKWAELTPKERERILQSKTEGFPAGYEDILAEYFRRLATEESVRAIAPGAAQSAAKKQPEKSP